MATMAVRRCTRVAAIPFLRKGAREDLRDATGAEKLPALKLPDGTVITHSRAILSWIGQQK
jgi:glutathione S-transferase